MSATPFTAGAASPPFARHTTALLAELGFDDAEAAELRDCGAVVTGSARPAPVRRT